MGGSKGDMNMQSPTLTGLLGGMLSGTLQGHQQAGQAQIHANAMSGIVGSAEFTTTLTHLNATVAKMQADLSVMQAALRDMGGHQSLLLGYIHYLNPDNGERPTDPMNYAEWSRLQQVSDVINIANAASA
jgi:hypothetical protein